MTQDDIQNAYFQWMCDKVSYMDNTVRYSSLLNLLHSIDFTYRLPLDGDRESDGFELRYRFGYENDIPNYVISSYLDVDPCSVLEMMVSLSLNCEDHIMFDCELGDRTSFWFWDMISNLGLNGVDNTHFDEEYVLNVVDIFQNREYRKDGSGGLFITKDPSYDMRRHEIWMQANHYFLEFYL